jgi:hypothetical protein
VGPPFSRSRAKTKWLASFLYLWFLLESTTDARTRDTGGWSLCCGSHQQTQSGVVLPAIEKQTINRRSTRGRQVKNKGNAFCLVSRRT